MDFGANFGNIILLLVLLIFMFSCGKMMKKSSGGCCGKGDHHKNENSSSDIPQLHAKLELMEKQNQQLERQIKELSSKK
ncbi:hypothetical protein BKP45_15390 [Anaerobacillus alkalidiazotrophicus]|uniref:Uncharacterized protein n=1 Tax=Anaerobacillus alkalidiazotrophicus TaxID=472963 RepID=A0A1S2M4V9_9BACI|nr:hypothetical protein [Anaerobacillus alkalidiazotrophicus]OIJ18907.1 hypothetical protein BKP45_15390 [Anaerobacillus alkalidiazotrophicus]